MKYKIVDNETHKELNPNEWNWHWSLKEGDKISIKNKLYEVVNIIDHDFHDYTVVWVNHDNKDKNS